MIHDVEGELYDVEGELYVYDVEGETAAANDD